MFSSEINFGPIAVSFQTWIQIKIILEGQENLDTALEEVLQH